jgi:hypothetical protein
MNRFRAVDVQLYLAAMLPKSKMESKCFRSSSSWWSGFWMMEKFVRCFLDVALAGARTAVVVHEGAGTQSARLPLPRFVKPQRVEGYSE